MAKQIKWKYELVFTQRFSTGGGIEPSETLFKEQLNDVNPFLIKFCRIVGQQEAKAGPNPHRMVAVRYDLVFYPEGMKELKSVPPIGSTNRWNYNTKEFLGDGFNPGSSPQDWVVSVLNNLDPSEAVYAKVGLEYQYGHPDRYTATVIVPQGAK
jgi:hypothetical protein